MSKHQAEQVIQTRQALRQALVELIAEKKYEDITVKEITERAEVGTKTFYRHFNDKDDLLNTIVDTLTKRFAKIRILPETLELAEQNALLILKLAANPDTIFHGLLKSADYQRIFQPMIDFGVQEVKLISDSGKAQAWSIPVEIVAQHFILGIINMVRQWLVNGMEVPIEDMAEYINTLVVYPIWNLQSPEANHDKE